MQSTAIESSVMGWWQPKHIRVDPVIGLLECKDDFVELKIVNSTKIDWLERSNSFDLFGVLEDGRRITICNCFVNFLGGRHFSGVFVYGVFINFYIMGLHYDKLQRNIVEAYLRFDEFGVWFKYRGWESQEYNDKIVLNKNKAGTGQQFFMHGFCVESVSQDQGNCGGFGKFYFEHASKLQLRIREKSLSIFQDVLGCCYCFEDFVIIACRHLPTNYQLELIVKTKKLGRFDLKSCFVRMRNNFGLTEERLYPANCITIDEYGDITSQLKVWESNYTKFHTAIFLYKRLLSSQDATIENELFQHAQIVDSILQRTNSSSKYRSSDVRRLSKAIAHNFDKDDYPEGLLSDAIACVGWCNKKSLRQRLSEFVCEYFDMYSYMFSEEFLRTIISDVAKFRNDYAHANEFKYSRERLWKLTLSKTFLIVTVQLLMLKLEGFTVNSSIALLSGKLWWTRLVREIEDSLSQESIGTFEGEGE